MKNFNCPCDGELECAFYNPYNGWCEMNDPVNNCAAAFNAFYAVEEANENQRLHPGAHQGA